MPKDWGQFGVKVVSRIEGRKPALRSSLTLYDTATGDILALMDANWITDIRTGAMAVLAIMTLRKADAHTYAFMGLGQIARATMKCFAELTQARGESPLVKLLRYKDQAERFAAEFAHYSHITFRIVDTIEELVSDSDVVVSAITDAKSLLVPDTSAFKPGVLLVPIHTRGFQNCDTVFDKIFGDDYEHIRGFQYFDRFRYFAEIGDVLAGKIPGRQSDDERIIAYNYGLALHDVYFAGKIYALTVGKR